jgi:hypothetical protein
MPNVVSRADPMAQSVTFHSVVSIMWVASRSVHVQKIYVIFRQGLVGLTLPTRTNYATEVQPE